MFEYKVVPAPTKGVKAKGVKTPEGRFALGIEQAINALARDGWEYQRSDVLPSDERQGLTGSVTHWRTLLVFRRALAQPAAQQTAPVIAPRQEPRLTAATAVPPPAPAPDRTPDAVYEEGSEETRPA